MQRHQQYLIIRFFHAVNVRNQSHFLQKFVQVRLIMRILISGHFAHQFINISDAFLHAVLVRFFQILHVAAGLQNILHQFRQRIEFLLAAE